MANYDANSDSRDPGIVLRASMGASMSDIHMPDGLLDRVVSRERKRKARIWLASAVGATAGVAAAMVVIATVPGQPSPARPTAQLHAQDAAYVLNQAAAAQVNSYRMISEVQDSTGLTYTDVSTQQQLNVSGRHDSSGEPYFKIATMVGGGAYTNTEVDYQDQVFSTFTTSSMDHGTPTTISAFLPLQTNANPAVAFSEALKAGIITVVGHQSLNGRDTILLRINPKKTHGPAVESLIWIDASTYLVVQTEHILPHLPNLPANSPSSVISQVSWLSPTPENLALLTLTQPAGFTKIPYSELVQKYLGPIS